MLTFTRVTQFHLRSLRQRDISKFSRYLNIARIANELFTWLSYNSVTKTSIWSWCVSGCYNLLNFFRTRGAAGDRFSVVLCCGEQRKGWLSQQMISMSFRTVIIFQGRKCFHFLIGYWVSRPNVCTITGGIFFPDLRWVHGISCRFMSTENSNILIF